jgi:hypothetical protein
LLQWYMALNFLFCIICFCNITKKNCLQVC